MIVVSDTTAISNLIRIDELRLLKDIFGHIILPKAVYEELLILEERGINVSAIIHKEAFEIVEVEKDALYHELNLKLDEGEVEAITLAIMKKADYLLIDEVKGREIAQRRNIPIIGTLGVLIEAKRRKLIVSIEEKMLNLKSIGFWISHSLYNKVVQLEKELE